MSSSTGVGWAQLRQHARQLESQTETLFHQYSQYASMTSLPAKPSDEEQNLQQQLVEMLQRREDLISSLRRIIDTSEPSSQTTLKTSHLTRHAQILSTHRGDLTRLQSQIQDARNKANLLHSVRRDIDSYRASSQNPQDAEAEYMLGERSRLDHSHNATDNLLNQAYAVNESFGLQREQLERVRQSAMHVAGMVPGVNGLIGRIGGKKRRDGIILGSFIAFCFLLFWFLS